MEISEDNKLLQSTRLPAREEKVRIRTPLGTYAPGDPGGPGRTVGRKDDDTIIQDAEKSLIKNILGAVPPRQYRRWLKNYAQRHPKEALKIATDLIAIRDRGSKGDTHVHLNLAELLTRSNKKEADKNG